MKSENKIKQVGNISFYMALLIELGIAIVNKSAYMNPIEGRLFQITFLLCMIKIVMTKYSFKEWLVMAMFFLLGAVSYFATGRNEIIRVVAFVAASKNINLRTVLKVTFYVTLAGMLSLVVMSFVGIMGEVFLETDFGRGAVERRYCFGMGHPNAAHCMFWTLTTLGLYLYWEKLKWYHCLVLEIANIGFYVFTLSRTGMAVATVTILIAAVFCIFPKLQEKKWVYVVGMICCGICIGFSVLAAVYGHNVPLFVWIDRYLTGRIQWAYLDGGASMWTIFSMPEHISYFDMGFIRLFYWYGIIPGIVYIAVKGAQLLYCMKKKDAASFLVITMFVLYTVFEAHAISVYIARDYALFLMVGAWSEMFGLEGACGYFWQPQKYLKRTEQ